MSSVTGYTGDYNFSRYTTLDNTGYWNVFSSGYKNIRFNIQSSQQIQLTAVDAANLPGLAYRLLGDTSLWRVLLAFNGLTDPISDIATGMILLIPTKAQVIAYLGRQVNTYTSLTI